MKLLNTALLSTCMAVAAAASFAQDATKHPDPMSKDGMAKKEMSMQECKDHMAMTNKDGGKKTDAMMKADPMCADMMKKGSAMHGDGAMNKPADAMPKSDAAPTPPAKK